MSQRVENQRHVETAPNYQSSEKTPGDKDSIPKQYKSAATAEALGQFQQLAEA